MGTTLTGTTIKTTYDSLIKVTDNGPLSGTAKYLSDGLGNDSALALSTAGVGVGTTTISSVGSTKVIEVGTAATGGTLSLGGSTAFRISGSTSGVDMYYAASAPINIYTAGVERLRIDATGNVGIGTSAPAGKLHISGDGAVANLIRLQNTGAGTNGFFDISVTSTEAQVIANYSTTAIPMLFLTGAAERMRITPAGYVGIGTSSPTQPLDVNGTAIVRDQFSIRGGITGFNPSYAASYAIDNNGSTTYFNATGGNVGIGTSTPSQKLHVSGGIALFCNTVIGSGADANSGLRIVAPIGTTHYNWMVAAQQNINDAFEITPSTTVGGTTFNSPALSILATTGVISIKSGIKFPATQVASADANTLDDYEEGTFTLSFAGNSTAGTYTPTAVNAFYTKIGRVVTLQYKATFASGASGGAGYMQISGLPFAYAANSGGLTGTVILSDASWGGSYLSMIPITSGSSTQMIINEVSPSTGLTNFVQATDFITSTDIRFTLTYQV